MASQLTEKFTIRGIELEVTYSYERGMKGDYLQPDDPDVAEVEDIKHAEESVVDLLSDAVVLEIEEAIYKKHSAWS